LPKPLGFDTKGNKLEIAKEISEMKLIGDATGFAYFNEVLFLAMRRSFGEKL
jgi:hypothetical protein